MEKSKVSVILPSYNEAEILGDVLKELIDSFKTWDIESPELIVVNDGSKDATAQIASRFKEVHLINHRKNKGYGAAIRTGMREAKGDILVWYDSDGQHRPEDLYKVIKKMQDEDLDYCIGIRDKDSYQDKTRVLGKKVLKWILTLITKEQLGDFNSGLRAFKRKVIMPYISLLPDAFGASTVTTFLMLEQAYIGGEVDITVRKRQGKSSVRQIRDGLRTIGLILQVIILFKPMRVFGKCGLMMLLAGGLYGIVRAIQWGSGIPILASILIIFGLQLVCFGVLAEQLSKMRMQEYENRYTYPKTE